MDNLIVAPLYFEPEGLKPPPPPPSPLVLILLPWCAPCPASPARADHYEVNSIAANATGANDEWTTACRMGSMYELIVKTCNYYKLHWC